MRGVVVLGGGNALRSGAPLGHIEIHSFGSSDGKPVRLSRRPTEMALAEL